jgi:hypothetical protein
MSRPQESHNEVCRDSPLGSKSRLNQGRLADVIGDNTERSEPGEPGACRTGVTTCWIMPGAPFSAKFTALSRVARAAI